MYGMRCSKKPKKIILKKLIMTPETIINISNNALILLMTLVVLEYILKIVKIFKNDDTSEHP